MHTLSMQILKSTQIWQISVSSRLGNMLEGVGAHTRLAKHPNSSIHVSFSDGDEFDPIDTNVLGYSIPLIKHNIIL